MADTYRKRLLALGDAYLRLLEYLAAGAPGGDAEGEALSKGLWDAVRRCPDDAAPSGTDEDDAVATAVQKACNLLLVQATWRGGFVMATVVTAIVILGWWTGSFPEQRLLSVGWWGAPTVIAGSLLWGMRCLRRLSSAHGERVGCPWSFAVLVLSLLNGIALVVPSLGVLAFLESRWVPLPLTPSALLFIVGALFGYLVRAARARW